MDRTACVDLPAFPLQLLLQDHPEWAGHPAAVVDRDHPQGILLWVNEKARARRILSGMRYGAALALAQDLRAAEMPAETIDRRVRALARRLRYFTPFVEPGYAYREGTRQNAKRGEGDPGLFWLDASGLERLHESLRRWAELVRGNLKECGFRSTVVVGFTRFGTYALAKAKRGVVVLSEPKHEAAAARQVPLDRLSLVPKTRDALDRVGVRTLGQFIALPEDGLGARFGKELLQVHRLASGTLGGAPLQPDLPDAAAMLTEELDYAETNGMRLFYFVEELLHPLLSLLAGRRQAVAELRLELSFEVGVGQQAKQHVETLRPAAPTLNAKQLLNLIRLRLEALKRLPYGVNRLRLAAVGNEATAQQLDLFVETPRRDLDAANRALARIRAELGNDAVVHATLREGHLPEGRFAWEPLKRLQAAEPRSVESGRLVRRMQRTPLPLPQRPRQEPDGWMLRGLADAPVTRVMGPYIVSGGWWRKPIHREYLFAETQRGELLWVYYDRQRRRWFLHGRLE